MKSMKLLRNIQRILKLTGMTGKIMRKKFHWLLVILYTSSFCVILPILCYDMKYSIYNHRQRSTLEERSKEYFQTNTKNLFKAKEHLSQVNQTQNHNQYQLKASEHFDVIINVITVARHTNKTKELGYLSQIVSKLLQLFEGNTDLRTPKIGISLCNVDGLALNHSEAQQLSSLLTIFQRFDKKYILDKHVHPKEKEKGDYIFCLNQTVQYDAQYVLMLEDDALPSDNLLIALSWLVSQYASSHGRHSNRYQGILGFIKLYHPERLLGFLSLEAGHLTDLLSLSVLAGFTLTYLCIQCLPERYLTSNNSYMLRHFIVYSTLVFSSIGRQNLVFFRHYLAPHFYQMSNSPRCCTPAVLYPKYIIPKLVSYFDAVLCTKTYAKDDALDDFAEKFPDYGYYLMQPNMVEHIGHYSALRQKLVEP